MLLLLTLFCVGCAAAATVEPATAVLPTTPPQTSQVTPEIIHIASPANGSRIISPVIITGESDYAFEGTLQVQIEAIGEEATAPLGQGFVMLNVSEIGQRGSFSGEVTFASPATPTPGRISVFMVSPRDGHIQHLASTHVTLLPNGETADMQTADPQPEAIAIYTPESLASITGGTVHITGFAAPTFEQNLAIEILDEVGTAVGTGYATINSSMGEWGEYTADITYTITTETPGAICVQDISPADGKLIHRNCIPVTLIP